MRICCKQQVGAISSEAGDIGVSLSSSVRGRIYPAVVARIPGRADLAPASAQLSLTFNRAIGELNGSSPTLEAPWHSTERGLHDDRLRFVRSGHPYRRRLGSTPVAARMAGLAR
ncbi:hypothetical protein Ade02nite_70960 [Paractinoplanes deccanensis]|uniref:Uncharacterized protein n=1 Tax=Paractinoplanes deccanensis TaxID=113561 RepID=A0ABQ3YEM3_9ACTN|nr:hypothetical protein Ade02nite_70960 [Actinoplanes deccanensis]